MGNTEPGSLSIFVVLSAILSHRWYFMRGEHHMNAHTWALGALMAPLVLCYLIHACFPRTWSSSLLGCLILTASWWSGFLSSVLFYRLLEHRLSKFPGSLLAKVTKLYHFFQCMHHNDYQFRSSQHATYGPIVRIGEIQTDSTSCNLEWQHRTHFFFQVRVSFLLPIRRQYRQFMAP